MRNNPSIHMKPSCLWKTLRKEDGQALPWMVMMTVLFLGMAGITADLGHAYICYRELQASTDAAALAGAYELSQTGATAASVKSMASANSSVTGGRNENPNFTTVTIDPQVQCLAEVTAMGVPCGSSTTNNNTVSVVQTATIPTYFIRVLSIFGAKSASTMTLRTTAKAAMAGGDNQKWNGALVIDTTGSMNNFDSDPSCNDTQMHCALDGVQTLLSSLSPCTTESAGSGTPGDCDPFDQIALFTFPNVRANTAYNDTTCNGNSTPTVMDYTEPTKGDPYNVDYSSSNATYQITGFLYDYSSNNLAVGTTGTLNSSSTLSIAAGAGKSTTTGSGRRKHTVTCPGMQAVSMDTYYAGAIYAAQSALTAQQAANPGSKNFMIILSDGDANSSSFASGLKANGANYPSTVDECTQGVNAANYAKSLGTTVYVVSYGAQTLQAVYTPPNKYGHGGGWSSGGCKTDVDYSITPCQALQQMASSGSTFFSDVTTQASGTSSTCTSQNDVSGIANIFHAITNSLTHARLIPSTWNTTS